MNKESPEDVIKKDGHGEEQLSAEMERKWDFIKPSLTDKIRFAE